MHLTSFSALFGLLCLYYMFYLFINVSRELLATLRPTQPYITTGLQGIERWAHFEGIKRLCWELLFESQYGNQCNESSTQWTQWWRPEESLQKVEPRTERSGKTSRDSPLVWLVGCAAWDDGTDQRVTTAVAKMMPSLPRCRKPGIVMGEKAE